MAEALDKNDPRRAMLLAAYGYRARFKQTGTTADYWESAAVDMEKTCHKHGNHPFVIDLLVACYADMEREAMRSG